MEGAAKTRRCFTPVPVFFTCSYNGILFHSSFFFHNFFFLIQPSSYYDDVWKIFTSTQPSIYLALWRGKKQEGRPDDPSRTFLPLLESIHVDTVFIFKRYHKIALPFIRTIILVGISWKQNRFIKPSRNRAFARAPAELQRRYSSSTNDTFVDHDVMTLYTSPGMSTLHIATIMAKKRIRYSMVIRFIFNLSYVSQIFRNIFNFQSDSNADIDCRYAEMLFPWTRAKS